MSENKKTAKPFTTGNDAVPISNAESPGNIVYEGENDPDYKMDLECRGNAIILILDGDKMRRAMEDAETLKTVVKDKWKLIGAKLRVESEHLDMVLKHIATSDDVLQNKSDCLFLAILYHETTFPIKVQGKKDLSLHDIWNNFTKEKNVKMTSRPKIFLFLEYPEIRLRGDPANSQTCTVDGKGKTPTLKSVTQPSHINFFFFHGYGEEFITTFANCVVNNPEMDLVDLATTINRELSSRNTERFSHYMSTLIRNLKFGSMRTYWSDDKDYQNKSEKLIKCIDINEIIKCEAANMLRKLDDIIADTIATEEMKNSAKFLSGLIENAQKDDSVVTVISHFRGLFDAQYKKYEELLAEQ